MQQTNLVIFDLDGTLLNTLSDLACSTNYALEKNGFPQHSIESYNYFVGNGINKLFEQALPDGKKTEENILKIRKTFLPYYDTHNTNYTKPYKGIPKLLNTLQTEGIKIAVASNKYQQATEKLISYYFPDITFIAIFGQREGIPAKPDPTVVHEIVRMADIPATDTLFVGDSGVDMQTASDSGITSIGVTWGFRPRSELETSGAVHIVDTTSQIVRIIAGTGNHIL